MNCYLFFAAYLQVWEYSKLSTGRSMQQLWDREVLQKTLDKHNRLTLESYNLIREFRKSQKEAHNLGSEKKYTC